MTSANIGWAHWEEVFRDFLQQQMAQADAAHDLAHVQRVVANAQLLAVEEAADLQIVLPAAWLHDCVVVPKDSPLRSQASMLAAQTAGDFLQVQGYPEQFIPDIQHAIEAHSFSANIAPRTREAEVVQDADRLDALGAIGIARCLMLGGANNKPLYATVEPFPEQRQVDDSMYVLDHFYCKLLKLADMMKTASGRAEAHRRTQFMRQFLAQLGREIGAIAP